jgi:hypothetical protein
MLERFKLASEKHTRNKKSPVLAIWYYAERYIQVLYMVKVKLYPS